MEVMAKPKVAKTGDSRLDCCSHSFAELHSVPASVRDSCLFDERLFDDPTRVDYRRLRGVYDRSSHAKTPSMIEMVN